MSARVERLTAYIEAVEQATLAPDVRFKTEVGEWTVVVKDQEGVLVLVVSHPVAPTIYSRPANIAIPARMIEAELRIANAALDELASILNRDERPSGSDFLEWTTEIVRKTGRSVAS